MNDMIASSLENISGWLWGEWVLIPLLSFVGIFLTWRIRALAWRSLPQTIKWLWRDCVQGVADQPAGDLPRHHALMAALAGALGTGNIAGVATAIHLGGVGAIFWMWLIALFGMATQYAEVVLAVHFREQDASGRTVGGPMYYIRKGLGARWHWLGGCFAFFGMIAAFGIGNMVQANSVADALHSTFQIPVLATGLVLAVLVAMVIIGEARRIGVVATALIPLMSVLYICLALLVVLWNIEQVPAAFMQIVHAAFNGSAATGGFLGATVAQAIRFGLARGIFSNEAGLGSVAIIHAAAKTQQPVTQGLVAAFGTFIDTIVICTMTAMVIILTGSWQTGLNGAELTVHAFSTGFGSWAEDIVSIALTLFAFTTLLSWSYYGERCAEFLFGIRIITPYRLLWIGVIISGSLGSVSIVWLLADIMNGLMALPNLLALLLLSPLVVRLTRKYESMRHSRNE